MAEVEASVRDWINHDRDCTEQVLSQMALQRKINLLIAEWKAAGGGDVLPDVSDRVRLRPEKKVGNLPRAVARR